MDVEFTLTGVDELQKNLTRLAQAMPQEAAAALYAEAQVEKTESMRRTPVLHGALRGSHHVTQPVIAGRDISVTIQVGGVAAPYAIFVHENLEALHRVGQAKFLESTLLESAPYLAQRVANRINLERFGR